MSTKVASVQSHCRSPAEVWGVATGASRVMLDEVRNVRVQATSAHFITGHRGVSLSLHTNLHKLRVLKEFKEALIKNHNLIQSNMVSHLFNTYIPRSELDLMKSNDFSTQIKCNKLDRLVSSHKNLSDDNMTTVESLRKETKM